MEADVKATDGAKALAEEKGLDLASVDGTGSGGQVTKGDVEKALEAAPGGAGEPPSSSIATATAEPEEKRFLVELNPKLGDLDRLVLYDSEGNAHVLLDSNPMSRVMSEDQFEDLNRAKHPPTAQYPRGFAWLIKGREVG